MTLMVVFLFSTFYGPTDHFLPGGKVLLFVTLPPLLLNIGSYGFSKTRAIFSGMFKNPTAEEAAGLILPTRKLGFSTALFGGLGFLMCAIGIINYFYDPTQYGPLVSVAAKHLFYGFLIHLVVFTPLANRFEDIASKVD